MWTGWTAPSLSRCDRPLESNVVVAVARISVVTGERGQDRIEGIKNSPEKRPSFPNLSVVRAFVRAVGDQPQAYLFAKRPEFVGVYNPVEYDRKGGAPGSPAFRQ